MNPAYAPAQRAILRLLQREKNVQRAALSVRIRPSYGELWDPALQDLIDRGILEEYGEILKRNGGRRRSVIMYRFTTEVAQTGGDLQDFMAMAPEAIDAWVNSEEWKAIPNNA